MKNVLYVFIVCCILLSTTMYAQSPQKFNYQGVARNSSGNPIVSSPIGLKLSITDGSTELYTETFSPTTNTLGLFNVEVGNGTPVSGTFSSIDWINGSKFLKVEMDASGGTSYTLMGTSQLISVPYALVANKAADMQLNDLTDVDASSPMTNQVLQWNGTEWVPATISVSGGDNWGSQNVITNIDLSGNGTSANPLTLAQQGAVTGQALIWNGTSWVPQNISGDNWGSQSAITNTTLTGNGTAAFPLGLAQQGAVTGQVLRWNGSAWVPQNISGDNWGTQSASTGITLTGNGTPGLPLNLSQQGATTGQVLKWSGSAWLPQNDEGLVLPHSYTDHFAGNILEITNSNSSGTSIQGTNTSSGVNAVAVKGVILNNNSGSNSSAVYGLNSTLSGTGYGVWGHHTNIGSGVYGSSDYGKGVTGYSTSGHGVYGHASPTYASTIGVFGEANGPLGIGVRGIANSTNGVGAYGSGLYGLVGTTADGRGVLGEATGTGYAGYFVGKTWIEYNSDATNPNLMIRETESTDYARLRFDNTTSGKFWEIAAINNATTTNEYFQIWHPTGNLLSLRGNGNLGLGVIAPAQKLDVAGNVQFTGALMPAGNAGTSGQVLRSNGAGTAPTWVSSTNSLYNNTYMYDQPATISLVTGTYQYVPGFNEIPFSSTGNFKLMANFNGVFFNNPAGGGNSRVGVRIVLKNSVGAVIKTTNGSLTIANDGSENINLSFLHGALGAGNYFISVDAIIFSGDTDVNCWGSTFGGNHYGQFCFQVIPQ